MLTIQLSVIRDPTLIYIEVKMGGVLLYKIEITLIHGVPLTM